MKLSHKHHLMGASSSVINWSLSSMFKEQKFKPFCMGFSFVFPIEQEWNNRNKWKGSSHSSHLLELDVTTSGYGCRLGYPITKTLELAVSPVQIHRDAWGAKAQDVQGEAERSRFAHPGKKEGQYSYPQLPTGEKMEPDSSRRLMLRGWEVTIQNMRHFC